MITDKRSGCSRMTLPLPLRRIPSRCHLVNMRLTVNGVTLAPDAKSSFPTGISIPSGPLLPIPLPRLSRSWATRDCASAELRLTLAPTNQAICSVTAIENALSSNLGIRVTNSRIVFRSHTSAQLAVKTSVLAKYLEREDAIAAPPKICPAVSQCRRSFCPSLVNTKCLPRPLVNRNSRSAESSW